ncbi:hypothetical protein [Caedibacter taeniospiralis]|jgi:hypothetical protein|uniref:hypothetical protein n=1 Tax=Caedibacter taeniospiralis TaxID=28907 RepID=UPI0037C15D90
MLPDNQKSQQIIKEFNETVIQREITLSESCEFKNKSNTHEGYATELKMELIKNKNLGHKALRYYEELYKAHLEEEKKFAKQAYDAQLKLKALDQRLDAEDEKVKQVKSDKNFIELQSVKNNLTEADHRLKKNSSKKATINREMESS